MGTVVQLLERSTRPAHAAAGAIQVDAVQMPLRAIRDQIVATANKCGTLGQSVNVLRNCLRTLDGIVGMIDDPETREKLQHQMKSREVSLLLASENLSRAHRTLRGARSLSECILRPR